ncbi:energy transducer TonB [Paraflavitalea sp. CAU 1676]|uniref:energy transducer TonB n=1 Tax=Paraflavitalea sp. CAU 1676 TaxID=3032598 RepID=UPI0023DC306E|nr:energy transducer TonB [Paraflavitalea sp. CAU 1676]MDF2193236.1 TonB family protein [Paraflavitalea sp. CAU 1676]
MKTFSTALCTFFALQSLAQSPDTRQVTLDAGDQSSKEVYYVSKADERIRDGAYQEFFQGSLVRSGSYKGNKRDGIWEGQYQQRVLSRKKYKNGERTGTWEFFHRETPYFQYDVANNVLYNLKEDTASYYYFATSGQWLKSRMECTPVPLMSPLEWQLYLERSLRYPPDALANKVQGQVDVEITIDESGNPIDYKVAASTAKALDEEALRLVRSFGFEFLPALKDGMKVRVKYTQPIIFRLP